MNPRPTVKPLPDIRALHALAWLCDPMHRRWIVWRWTWNNRQGKWDKPPFQVTGALAASNDPSTWTDYDTAKAAVDAGQFDGVGLMLQGLPADLLTATDLDNVRNPDSGALVPWAASLVRDSATYAEVTPSGCGVRILGSAIGLDTVHRNGPHPEGGRFELFANCPRYITVSGDVIADADITDYTNQVAALAAMLVRPAANGDHSTDPALDRSAEFFRALRTLKARGHSFAQAAAAFDAANKYRGRLDTEIRRTWDKLEPAPYQPPPLPGRILTGEAFVARHVPPVWLIDGIVQRSRLYACTSLTGHGKTAVWLFNACMIHAGRSVGRLDAFRGNVLILSGENPADLEARMLGMAKAYNLSFDRLPYVLPGSFPMTDDEADALKAEIGGLGVPMALIIGDTAASFFPGEDENDNVQAGQYARILRTFTDCPGNPAVVVLSHPVKNASRNLLLPRGGGAFLNELDGNLVLWSEVMGEITELHWQGKIRGPDFLPLGYRLREVPTGMSDEKDRPEMTVIAEPMSEEAVADQAKQTLVHEDFVLRALRDHPMGQAEIARTIGWVEEDGRPSRTHRSWVYRALQVLTADGLVRPARSTGGKYELTGKGAKVAEKLN